MTNNLYLPGTINVFTVLRETPIGYLLIDESSNEYFLHKNECNNQKLKPKQSVNAYLYFDNKRRLACTLLTPLILKDEIKFLKVKDTNYKLGVFLDNNISKELLLSVDYLPFNKSLWPTVGSIIPVRLKATKTALKAVVEKEDFKKYDGDLKEKVIATISLYEKDDMILITDSYCKIKVLKSGYLIKRKIGTKVEVIITYLGFSDTLGIIEDDKTEHYQEIKKLILSYLFRFKHNRNTSYFTTEITQRLFNLSHKEFKKLLSELNRDGLINIKSNIITLKEELHD